jgi:phosphatidylinositol 4-kinase
VSVSYSVRDHFIRTFGSPDGEPFRQARDRFVESLAAYSLATYILQVKDRHDGNILLDNEGHLVHIDFGFMLSNSPGYVGFESAPFKLSPEYIELLGGMESPIFARFKDLFFSGLLALRSRCERIILIVEIMQKNSRLPCFYAGESCVTQLKQRFHLDMSEKQLRHLVDRLVIGSAYSVFTRLYDSYQYYSHGIL